MKHVFPTAEIFHLFAHKRRDDIRNSQGNVSIEGDTLFSYSMPIARHLETCTLMRSGSSTMTTNKHLSQARRALVGRVVHVEEVSDDPVWTLVKQARQAIEHAARPRIQPDTRMGQWHAAEALLADARFLAPTDKRIPKLPLLDGDAKSIIQGYAVELLKADWRAEMKSHVTEAQRRAEHARDPLGDNPPPTTYIIERKMYSAQLAARYADDALKLAKRLNVKPPRGMTTLGKGMGTLLKTLQAARGVLMRADTLGKFNRMLPKSIDRWDMARLCEWHEELAATDPTPETTVERELQLQTAVDGFNKRATTAFELDLDACERELTDDTIDNLAMPTFFNAECPSDLALRYQALQPAIAAFNAAKFAERITQWRLGVNASLPHDIPPMLRLSKDCSTIETSWGARVPASIAPMVWAAAGEARRTNTSHELPHPKPELGNYRLDAIMADGSIKAGCHTIAFAELQGIAPLVGLS